MDFTLQPGEKLSQEILEKLQKANENYSTSKSFPKYLRDLKEIFPVEELKISTESKFFLAGFLEGEASLNVSAKKLKTATFGLLIDPEFSITQHVNGFATLYLALQTLQAGRIRHKTGSNATLALIIDNRQTLEEKVVPFYENYVEPYGSPEKVRRLQKFKALLRLFNNNAHRDQNSFVKEILPIWDEMRKQKSQLNESFSSLLDAQNYVVEFVANKPKK